MSTSRTLKGCDTSPSRNDGGNAYPTARWLAGEVVSESVELTLEAGTYRLATGWYDPISRDRLPALSADGNPLAGNRLILEADIRVP